MQHNIFALLFGMPGGSEWILIIVALVILFAPVVVVIYLLKRYLDKKKDKNVMTRL